MLLLLGYTKNTGYPSSSGNHAEENSPERIRPYRRETFIKDQKLLKKKYGCKKMKYKIA
jgi:hypothetical protein